MTEKITIQIDQDSKIAIDSGVTPLYRNAMDSKTSIEACIADITTQIQALQNAKIESNDADIQDIVQSGIKRQMSLLQEFKSSLESWKNRIYNPSQYMY